MRDDAADAKAERLPILRHRIEDMSDEHINQMRRFADLPPLTAEEAERLRSFSRWMRGRFAPETVAPPANNETPLRS
jgi:hypothetical protein